MKMEEILESFHFESADHFLEWKSQLFSQFVFDDNRECCLYTDGDDGLALLQISGVFDEGGLSVALIDCAYCDIQAADFIGILTTLIKAVNYEA